MLVAYFFIRRARTGQQAPVAAMDVESRIPGDIFAPVTAAKEHPVVFLTHNWGEAPGYANHKLVSVVNAELNARGVRTWFDEQHLEGKIVDAMVKGLDQSSAVVVFVTTAYMNKVNGPNQKDNCKLEFKYAMDKLPGRFVCVVTEEAALNSPLWGGIFKMHVQDSLYINLCPSVKGEARNEALDKLAAKIQAM